MIVSVVCSNKPCSSGGSSSKMDKIRQLSILLECFLVDSVGVECRFEIASKSLCS